MRPTIDAARAAHPVDSGFAADPASGVRVAWDAYGEGDPTILFIPSTPIVHSRQWKGQVPFFARHHRVVTFDGRGNGRSDRPPDPDAYREEEFAADALAVMDATGTPAAVLVGLCGDGVWRSIQLAVRAPERVLGIVAFAPGVPRITPPSPSYTQFSFVVEGADHMIPGRHPVLANLLIRDFVRSLDGSTP